MPTAELDIRAAVPHDLPQLLRLIKSHAAFEKAEFDAEARADPLAAMLFERPARLHCFVALDSGSLAGYATASLVASTWDANEYLHMDTLFVEEAYRSAGLGRRLFASIERCAADLNVGQIQWQTPAWNTDAVRFYEGLGAQALSKTRFILQTSLRS